MSDIQPQQINIDQILKSKNKTLSRVLPWFVKRYIKRIAHQDEINQILRNHGDKLGVDFISANLKDFNISVEVYGEENIPAAGRHIFASNHPLGGFDGVILLWVLSKYYGDQQRFLVNDILMNIKNLAPLFVPINKHGKQAGDAVKAINKTFESDMQVLTFPAGLVSRRIKGAIVDLEWKKTVISRSIKHQRDIVPVYFTGKNSDFFYNLSKFRKKMGIKANIEMFYLVDELMKHKNSTVKLTFGKPITYKKFDKTKNYKEWAFWLKQQVYNLNNQAVEF